MIVKFFANKRGGTAKASIRYLLDKPADKVTVLSGDPQLSLNIADNLDFNHKYTVGCLSFEELHINEDDKHKIMEYFENTIFAGLEPDQFNITWIEHTDKKRLELNFFIPNVEMTTQRKLQPYYDKLDRPLIENFKQVTNQKYKLSDPNSSEKKQLFITTYNLPKDKQQATEIINNSVLKMAQNGIISNRDDVINHLEKNGLEVVRATNKSTSIKTDGQNLRLKGAFYEKDFRVSQDLRGEIESRGKKYRADVVHRNQRSKEKLAIAIESSTARHQIKN